MLNQFLFPAGQLIEAYKALCCRMRGDHRRTMEIATLLEIHARKDDYETRAFWRTIQLRAKSRQHDSAYKPCGGCPGRK